MNQNMNHGNNSIEIRIQISYYIIDGYNCIVGTALLVYRCIKWEHCEQQMEHCWA